MVWPLRYWLKQTAGAIIVCSLALLHPAIYLPGPTATAGQAAKLPFPAGEHGLESLTREVAPHQTAARNNVDTCRGTSEGTSPGSRSGGGCRQFGLDYSVASSASGSQVSARAVCLSLKYDKCALARTELHFPQTPIASVHFASSAHLGIPFTLQYSGKVETFLRDWIVRMPDSPQPHACTGSIQCQVPARVTPSPPLLGQGGGMGLSTRRMLWPKVKIGAISFKTIPAP